MSETLIKVEGVSKKFCKDLKRSLWYGVKDIGSSLMGVAPGTELRKGEFWAVKDVSFEVKRGECLGLIGHNGAGKSTLLKMLNGLIRPDEGRIEMRGKIGALIELGAGFNPVLTGRENVYNNGAVLGFTTAEIDQKFDKIVAFAELEEFIDMPVQNYSSGMKVRLGFAVASQMEPDILLVDEVLAVGDLGFRIKCFNEIYRLIENTAVILVSHSMPQVAQVCRTGILLKDGKAIYQTTVIADAIVKYYDMFKHNGLNIEGSKRGKIVDFSFGNRYIKWNYLDFKNEGYKKEELVFDDSDNIQFRLTLEIDASIEKFGILFSITDIDQKLVAQVMPNNDLFINNKNLMVIEAKISSFLLNTGSYTVSIHVYNESQIVDRGEIIIGIRNIAGFKIKKDKYIGGAPILYQSNWKVY